jgi:UDP-N-acetylglucosamine diphosphorylase / glucose-1-phosphate thymidylyltransferase / UDP-N-acetylgalactosamine diphosphorylase / glucosamine-1-phosphate N-acetyltransferase / galactosamine-1-phosphate N-acetyltransferase
MTDQLKVSNLLDLSRTQFPAIFDNVEYPWEILSKIGEFILKIAPTLPPQYRMIGRDIWVGEGTVIADSAYIEGPAIIGANCEIRHNAFIRGNAIIGDDCVIGNATEIKNSFLFDSVQAPHFNYVGDSVMGYKSHIGAGVILSNVKSIPGTVTVKTPTAIIETGLRKFSAILGDNTEVGCNTVLNPGTILGRKVIVYPLTNARGLIPENHILKNDGTMRAQKM